MPSKSKKQAKLMAAVAHNPKFAKKVGIPVSVGREFNNADRGRRFADGGEVLPSSTDDDEEWTDTYVKRPLGGLASMWSGLDPETGELVNPAWHNIKRIWNADERRRQGLPPQQRAKLGIAESAKALPGLAYTLGSLVKPELEEAKPDWIREAEDAEDQITTKSREALDLDAPHGFVENLTTSAGVMAGQLPIPGSQARKLKLLKEGAKNPGKLRKIGSSAVEWFSPTIDPKLKNYASGTAFGGILGGAADYLGDFIDEKQQAKQQQEWISEAMAEVLAEEQGGGEEDDEAALAELGYAEGGKVSGARKAIGSLRSILQQADPDDVATRKAAIDGALHAIKGTTVDPMDRAHLNTLGPGLSDAAADAVPERRRQRFGDYERNILDLLERRVAPTMTEQSVPTGHPMRRATDLPAPPALPAPRPDDPQTRLDRDLGPMRPDQVYNPSGGADNRHGALTQAEFDAMLQRIKPREGFAEGGAAGLKDPRTQIPAPQSQKEAMANAANDPRGSPLSQEWYENYGAGPEHLFLGDRTVKLHDMWGPQHPGAVPNTQTRPEGSWLPAAGILGFAAYDEWKKRRGEGEDTSQAAFWQQQHDSAANTQDTDAWVNQQLEQYGNNAPMPVVNDDGTVSYVQPNKFWSDMHSSASNTADTDAWVNSQLENYANDMAMPMVNDDGSISYVDKNGNPVDPNASGLTLGRAWQGVGGAYDAYSGLQQGGVEGYAQAIGGMNDLYGSYLGGDTGMLGQGAGTIGGLASIYGGIKQGGVQGYTQAASGALQTANSLGYNVAGGAAGVAGKAIPVIGALYSAYGAYESAKVGDKKGAVAQGAAAGAAIGSVVPVIGTAVGAVVGAVVGLIGASLGNKDNPSELAYGAHKKLAADQQVRGWTPDQINGAVFETIKSHTKSGNINRFKDVAEMYSAFGITKDAHKNYKNVQTQMGDFIKGVVSTAQQMGSLPTDPAALKQLDGQKIYYQVVVPALAAKYKETTGKDSEAWNTDKIKPGEKAYMHELMADWTDWMTSHWNDQPAKAPVASTAGGGNSRRMLEKAHGGYVSAFDRNPRAGALASVYH